MAGGLTDGVLLRVLIIEDEPADQAIVVANLRRGMAEHGRSVGLFKLETTTVDTLARGLKAMREHRFHAVLADLQLPDSASDAETLERLRAADAIMPIIAVTGNDTVRNAVDASLSGADAFISKSELSPEPLVRLVISTVWRKRLS